MKQDTAVIVDANIVNDDDKTAKRAKRATSNTTNINNQVKQDTATIVDVKIANDKRAKRKTTNVNNQVKQDTAAIVNVKIANDDEQVNVIGNKTIDGEKQETGTCSSLEFIDDVKKSLVGSRNAAKCGPHFDAIEASYSEPIKLFRTLDKFFGPEMITFHEADNDRNLMQLSTINCHNGQRKLALSVIDFLALSTKSVEDPLVVYAGASGLATVIAATIFPKARFILYDKAHNTVQLISKAFIDIVIHRTKHATPDTSKRIVVYQEWFDDAEALKFSKFKNVLFISDVRGDDTTDLAIAKDMGDQQRWAILTGSLAYMFKFRVPYNWSPEIRRAYSDTDHLVLAAAKSGVKFTPPKKKNAMGLEDIEYLDGDAHIQLYGRPTTAELRLIGFAPKQTYKTRTFCVPEIEAKMATFNAFYRSHARFSYGRHSSSFFKTTFPGYDAVAEFSIASRCNFTLGRPMTVEGIARTVGEISRAIDEFIEGKSTPEQCSIKSSGKSKFSTHVTRALVDKCRTRVDPLLMAYAHNGKFQNKQPSMY